MLRYVPLVLFDVTLIDKPYFSSNGLHSKPLQERRLLGLHVGRMHMLCCDPQ